ncbi:MAG: hypothetical protein WBC21_04060 [Minisyncoccales bacterium]
MSIFIILTIIFIITSSIVTFDKRLIQAKRSGTLPPDEPMLPSWVGIIGWIHWGLALALLIIDWKYAIIVFIAMFLLAVLPVLEIIGNMLMSPFKQRVKLK